MLAGEAAATIWNDVATEGRANFYAWHQREHMPERVGIPGFRRGRRYVAIDTASRPEFFTLYEVDTMQVLQGQDYTARLNAPTDWTRRSGQYSRNSSRGLTRVVASVGEGMGGVILTLRFDAEDASQGAIARLIRSVADQPRICGAHLCIADAAASAVLTEEKRGRADIQAPPRWVALVEATDAEALAAALPDAALAQTGARGAILRGTYRLEHVRTKTAWTA